MVATFKHPVGYGYIDSILELKSKSHYDYIHECYFLSQVVGQKVFIFKMSINGVGSGAKSRRVNATWRGFAECLDHV
jgi:hypothetical protein